MTIPTHQYKEDMLFEYNIARELEKYKTFDLVNYRDICRFAPESFSEFVRECTVGSNDTSMIEDGIYHYATDHLGCKYFIDTYSGLILRHTENGYSVAQHTCTSKQYDIFDAAFLRKFLKNRGLEKTNFYFWGDMTGEITTLNYLGIQIKNIFSTPILEYEVSSREELTALIEEITSILAQSKFFKKLWFRGQRKEFTLERSLKTIHTLGLPEEYARMPSLIPSAGRSTALNNYDEVRRMSMYWTTAFKVWLLSQGKHTIPEFRIGGSLYMDMIRSLEPNKMVKFLMNNPYDVDEYVFAQDAEPMWASVLASQQYGGCTSMLDITDDIDVALFFTRSTLNRNTGRYEFCDSESKSVIYLLAEPRGSSTVDLSDNIFSDMPYDEEYAVPPRILNQHCGLLRGADMFGKNTYAYRILAKINIVGNGIETTKTVEEMFPSVEQDTLYKTYSYAEPKLTGLYG